MAIAHSSNLSNTAGFVTVWSCPALSFILQAIPKRSLILLQKKGFIPVPLRKRSAGASFFRGSPFACLMSPQKLMLVRDPPGFRPLCFGKTADGIYVAASESAALSAVGAEFTRDVAPVRSLYLTARMLFRARSTATKNLKSYVLLNTSIFPSRFGHRRNIGP